MVDYGYNENRSGYSGRSSTYTQAVSSNADRSGKYIYLINSLHQNFIGHFFYLVTFFWDASSLICWLLVCVYKSVILRVVVVEKHNLFFWWKTIIFLLNKWFSDKSFVKIFINFTCYIRLWNKYLGFLLNLICFHKLKN